MASEVLEQLRPALLQLKEQNDTNPTPDDLAAASMAAVRKGNDELVGGMAIVPEQLTLEGRVIGGQWGEYATYNSSDPSKRTDSIILYIHGGAFENGSVIARRNASLGIAARAKMDCFSIEYTQWPEGHHPQGLLDCAAAFQAVVEQGYAPDHIYLAGDSAGATMVIALPLYLKDRGESLPGGIIAMSPVTDMEDVLESRTSRDAIDPMISHDIGASMMRRYFKGADPTDHLVSVRYGSFEGFPPTFISVGEQEVLYDDAAELHELLDKAGVRNQFVEYPGVYHTFQVFPAPESEASFGDMTAFLFE